MRLTTAAIALALALVPVSGCASSTQEACGPSPTPSAQSALNGTYRFTFDRRQATINGAPLPPDAYGTYPIYWAIRSVCSAAGWRANAVKLDPRDRTVAWPQEGRASLSFSDGKWNQNSRSENRYQQKREDCIAGGKEIKPGADTINANLTLHVAAEGALTGVEVRTVVTNECGWAAAVITAPFTAERVGEIAAQVTVPEPKDSDSQTDSIASSGEAGPLPALDGVYRIELDNLHSTINGKPNSFSNRTQLYALRSGCSASRCIATGVLLKPDIGGPPGSTLVLESSDGQWTQKPALFRNICGSDGWATRVLELQPQPDSSLTGSVQVEILTSGGQECATVGDNLIAPLTARRVDDVPPAVVLADPALLYGP